MTGSVLLVLGASLCAAGAAVPHVINYQGRMVVNGVNFDGNGQFKFALTNDSGTTLYWGNSADTTPADGVPDTPVSLPVTRGVYSVNLGDTAIPNMAAIVPAVFSNESVYLRVWFNDGTNSWQQLAPDRRITAVGYALMAENVADGAITTAKLAPGAVTADRIAPGAITPASIGAETPEAAQAKVDALAGSLGGGMNALKAMLAEGRRTASIHIISDSTNANGAWSNQVATAIGALYPQYTVKRTDWVINGTTWTAPVTIQSGTGGSGERRWEFPAGATYCPSGYWLDFPMPKGDLDLRAKVRIDNNSATSNIIFSKADNGKMGFILVQESAADSRKLSLAHTTNGGANNWVRSSAGLSSNNISDGTPYWARVTVDIDNGAGGKTFTFYTSLDGSTWTPLGTPITTTVSGTLPFFDGANCYLGGQGGTVSLTGAIYAAEIRDGIDGGMLHPLNLDAWAFNEGSATLKGAPELWISNAAHNGAAPDHFLALPVANYCRNYSPQIILISLSHNSPREAGNRYISKIKELVTRIRSVYGDIPRIIFLTQNPQLRVPMPYDPNTQYMDALAAHRAQFISWASGAGYGVIDTWAAFENDPRPLETLVGTNIWMSVPITAMSGNGTTVTVNVGDMTYLGHPSVSRVAVIGATHPDGSPSRYNGAWFITAKSGNASGAGWVKFACPVSDPVNLTNAIASSCDGVHPSTTGYKLWADTIFAAFKRGQP